MRVLSLAIAAAALLSTPAYATQCRNAKGQFIRCPATAAPKPATRCKLNGKFAKCTTPGAKPV